MDILLATINARYAHSALALRWLRANLGEAYERSEIVEFTLGARIEAMAEKLLDRQPRLVALSVYIWNVEDTTRLVATLKAIRPELIVVIGGPEVSHETDGRRIVALADYVITGPGERSFARLCAALLAGQRPADKMIAGEVADPDTLKAPYALYTDEDLARRNVYVEASRGCPFRCQFCLSALDRTAVPFAVGPFLEEMDHLYRRGARVFRFIDRTFNLKSQTATAILRFFLERIERAPDDPPFAHFELVPDRLPAALRDLLPGFPAGTLQFEIGVQTWDPTVQALIDRRQDNDAAAANIAWLRANTTAHLHVDLIAGLPGEDLAGFGRGFDRLHALGPHEIQIGILKRLPGAPIARHTRAFDLRFSPDPPYNVLATDRLDFSQVQRISRVARYWDLLGNSGRFPRLASRVARGQPFERLLALSDWLYARTDTTYRIAPERLGALVAQWLIDVCGESAASIDAALADDVRAQPGRIRPSRRPPPQAVDGAPVEAPVTGPSPASRGAVPPRQVRFMRVAQAPK